MSCYTFESLNYFSSLSPCHPCRVGAAEGKGEEIISWSTCFLTKAVEQVKPTKVYNNFKENRLQLLKDQKDKTGVYCLVNLINGHIYIGSSINLSSRMKNYLNNTFLIDKKNKNIPIVKALLKYGQDSFAVLIVEYVNAESLTILLRRDLLECNLFFFNFVATHIQ